MDDSRTVPVQGALLTCPRCFAESDKTQSIEHMRSQMNSGRPDKRSALVARCIGCDLPILVVSHADGRVEALDSDPYDDATEDGVSSNQIAAAPGAKTDDAATSRYEEGQKLFENGNYRDAFAYWRAAHDWLSMRPDSTEIVSALLSNMGMALSRLHSPEDALSCFQGALSAMDENDSPPAYATVLNNIGGAYLHLGRMDEAEEYHRRAYELHVSKGSDKGLVARERHNLAFVYATIASRRFRVKELDTAIESVRRATDLYDGPDLAEQGSLYFLMLGNLLRRKGDEAKAQLDFDGALVHYEEALQYHETAKAHEQLRLQCADRLSGVNRELGRIDQALDTMQKSDELRETLSKRPPVPLFMWRRRGHFSQALHRIVQLVGAPFSRKQSIARRTQDEP